MKAYLIVAVDQSIEPVEVILFSLYWVPLNWSLRRATGVHG